MPARTSADRRGDTPAIATRRGMSPGDEKSHRSPITDYRPATGTKACRRAAEPGGATARRYADDIILLEDTRDQSAGVPTATKSRRIPIAHPVPCARSRRSSFHSERARRSDDRGDYIHAELILAAAACRMRDLGSSPSSTAPRRPGWLSSTSGTSLPLTDKHFRST